MISQQDEQIKEEISSNRRLVKKNTINLDDHIGSSSTQQDAASLNKNQKFPNTLQFPKPGVEDQSDYQVEKLQLFNAPQLNLRNPIAPLRVQQCARNANDDLLDESSVQDSCLNSQV
mmetsp:Transcript_6695/g.11251  ORF Transcript_6695/g.11251 Transcript_6695/m.11251 type:complete len:117 (+) Transcript_6695:1030-1380(+)